MYKTLPSSLRRKASSSAPPPQHSHHDGGLMDEPTAPTAPESSVFGGIHLNISNLFTGGVSQFLGQFRKKTPSSPTSPAPSLPPPQHHGRPAPEVSACTSASLSSSATTKSTNPHRESCYLNRYSLSDESGSCSSSFDEGREGGESFELIEFPSLSGEETGSGHSFFDSQSSNPAWCDHCGQIIWGIYDNVGSKCSLCEMTCHKSCALRVRIDCTAEKEEDTLADVSELWGDEEGKEENEREGSRSPVEEDEGTLKVSHAGSIESSFEGPEEEEEDELEGGNSHTLSSIKSDSVYSLSQAINHPGELHSSIELYNSIFPPGQKTILEEDDGINGFIRVTMNLRRPINVIAGMRPPSIYRMDESMEKQRTLTTFHLAPNTVKAIHVNSSTSTRDVIRFLLAKFRIADNPHKYALYERYSYSQDYKQCNNKTLGRIKMRHIAEDELPLLLTLRWATNGLLDQRSLVLQENDPGEICWEAFSSPELKNFLVILDREEAWYKKSIHEKYDYIREYMEGLLLKKKNSGGGVENMG
ncbi:ras association domain-containing protein 1 [Lepeophtheirus salmonis]|uniref:ras association domain-containing protein 1 n=1 Tax=Lepeophtheirus salmonis TaxID=72036 RepID=UPI001AE2BA3B|nr:ras association domain-containing protein 1-like [Lepeophtheirus salmonis]XP_040583407.1 ras association domain-containing protein 1-like [Lepeophtheirus salmonis]XP_040583408.1 ras association domain-containing protein 1-like [Lepeophtheirus salmonis]XP_040583409.1 ras association domain-containing protein 1-like [Lepeophtheirus salmonis]